MKAIVYARVSGRSQRDGTGLDEQVSACTAYAVANGYEVAGEFRDVVSGEAEWQDRPQALAMVERLALGGLECVLVHQLDRVARGRSGIFEGFLGACADAGASVISVVDGVLTEESDCEFKNADSEMIRSIKQAIIRQEKRKLVTRMKLGKLRAAKAGKHTDGVYQYGHDPRRPEESAILECIRLRAARGESGRSIAKALNADGVPARKAPAWSSQAVSGIIRRSTRAE